MPGAFFLFQLFLRRQVRRHSDPVPACVLRDRGGRVPEPPQGMVSRDPQHPVSKLATAGLELAESLDRQQPHLLCHLFGDSTISPEQVIGQPVHLAHVAVIHDRPRRPVAPAILRTSCRSLCIFGRPCWPWCFLRVYIPCAADFLRVPFGFSKRTRKWRFGHDGARIVLKAEERVGVADSLQSGRPPASSRAAPARSSTNQRSCFLEELLDLEGFVPVNPRIPRSAGLYLFGSVDPLLGFLQGFLRLVPMPEFIVGHRQEEPVPRTAGKAQSRTIKVGNRRFIIDRRDNSSRRGFAD